jgi:hypothetical protein
VAEKQWHFQMILRELDFGSMLVTVGVPVFLAQRLAGFFAVWCRTKKLAMATPGIGNEYLFAANAPALMVFHIKHRRKPLCWHN